MAVKIISIFILFFVLFTHSTAHMSTPDFNPYPKAISDLKEMIMKAFAFQFQEKDHNNIKISGFDLRDANVGHSVAYEFDLEIDDKVLPFKLLEDVNRWEYVDLPIFHVEEPGRPGDDNGLVQTRKSDDDFPVLAPFQLAGPMELWIQDGKDMRISLPHDVDAGVLKKVILADGAVVTIKGARSVSLRHPLDLPLPLNRTGNGFASGLLALAEQLRHTSRTQDTPLLSLRIVGPTSLTATPSSSSSPTSHNKLKLKRLAPGLVDLSSPLKMKANDHITPLNLHDEAPTLMTPNKFNTLWPLTSLNVSNSNLVGFEELLSSILGPEEKQKGSFKLLKADVSVQTFLKIGFGVETKLKEGDGGSWEAFPKWRTKPEIVRLYFEVLAKVDGDKVVPEQINQVSPPVIVEETLEQSVLSGNISMSRIPIYYPPQSPFSL